jgi:hypothetical protein
VSGCTDCTSKGGCDTRKADERVVLASLLRDLYPTRTWGDADDAAWFGAGVSEAEGRRLARAAAAACRAPAYFRAGAEDEVCDHVYVLCVGREPGLALLHDAAHIDSLPDGEVISERYLRLSLSRMARVAALQEVAIELRRDHDVWIYEERPRPGVYDPILLARTQAIVELAVANDLVYFDFGMITKPPETYDTRGPYDARAYQDRYGQAPQAVNYLFYAQPATAVTTVVLPAAS